MEKEKEIKDSRVSNEIKEKATVDFEVNTGKALEKVNTYETMNLKNFGNLGNINQWSFIRQNELNEPTPVPPTTPGQGLYGFPPTPTNGEMMLGGTGSSEKINYNLAMKQNFLSFNKFNNINDSFLNINSTKTFDNFNTFIANTKLTQGSFNNNNLINLDLKEKNSNIPTYNNLETINNLSKKNIFDFEMKSELDNENLRKKSTDEKKTNKDTENEAENEKTNKKVEEEKANNNLNQQRKSVSTTTGLNEFKAKLSLKIAIPGKTSGAQTPGNSQTSISNKEIINKLNVSNASTINNLHSSSNINLNYYAGEGKNNFNSRTNNPNFSKYNEKERNLINHNDAIFTKSTNEIKKNSLNNNFDGAAEKEKDNNNFNHKIRISLEEENKNTANQKDSNMSSLYTKDNKKETEKKPKNEVIQLYNIRNGYSVNHDFMDKNEMKKIKFHPLTKNDLKEFKLGLKLNSNKDKKDEVLIVKKEEDIIRKSNSVKKTTQNSKNEYNENKSNSNSFNNKAKQEICTINNKQNTNTAQNVNPNTCLSSNCMQNIHNINHGTNNSCSCENCLIQGYNNQHQNPYHHYPQQHMQQHHFQMNNPHSHLNNFNLCNPLFNPQMNQGNQGQLTGFFPNNLPINFPNFQGVFNQQTNSFTGIPITGNWNYYNPLNTFGTFSSMHPSHCNSNNIGNILTAIKNNSNNNLHNTQNHQHLLENTTNCQCGNENCTKKIPINNNNLSLKNHVNENTTNNNIGNSQVNNSLHPHHNAIPKQKDFDENISIRTKKTRKSRLSFISGQKKKRGRKSKRDKDKGTDKEEGNINSKNSKNVSNNTDKSKNKTKNNDKQLKNDYIAYKLSKLNNPDFTIIEKTEKQNKKEIPNLNLKNNSNNLNIEEKIQYVPHPLSGRSSIINELGNTFSDLVDSYSNTNKTNETSLASPGKNSFYNSNINVNVTPKLKSPSPLNTKIQRENGSENSSSSNYNNYLNFNITNSQTPRRSSFMAYTKGSSFQFPHLNQNSQSRFFAFSPVLQEKPYKSETERQREKEREREREKNKSSNLNQINRKNERD